MTPHEVADRLHGTPRGDRWDAKCPAHEDRRASLSIGSGSDGRVLLKCHAGCGIDAILGAAQLDRQDLFPQNTTGTSRAIAATYAYHDESGAHLFDVVRFTSPKDFRQRRADGVWSMQGVRRVIYRLHELQGQSVVYIAEGEKDVATLNAIGIIATTNPGGASKGDKPKWLPDYTRQIAAAGVRKVVILPDNDEAGRRHGDAVARSLHAAGLEVKVVALPNLPSKGDVSDWINAGHTKADLTAIVKATDLYIPTTRDGAPAAVTEGPIITTVADVPRQSVDWMWKRRFARGKLHIVGGEPGEGKSTLLLDVSARITRRDEYWPDGEPVPHGHVLVLSAEDGLADTIAPRLDAAGANDSLVHVLTAIRSIDGATRGLDLARDVAQLEAAIRQVQPVLVLLDPISAYLPKVDTWRDSDVRSVLAPLAALAEKYGCAIVAVMHLTKNAGAKILHRLLGSVGFVAAARIVLAVATDPDDPERRLLLPVKNNLAQPAAVLAFRRDGDRIAWETEPVTGLTADSVMSATMGDPHERQDAEAFLREMLVGGEPVPAADVLRAARANGIADRTLHRVKAKLGVRSKLVGFGATGKWHWWKPVSEIANPPATGTEIATPIRDRQETATHKLATSGNLCAVSTTRDCQEIATLTLASSGETLTKHTEIPEIANRVEGESDARDLDRF